jgi:hypothetical protein
MSDINSSTSTPSAPEKPKKKMNVWVIIAIVVGALIVLGCIAAVILPLIGSAIGGVFGNIQSGLQTPF